MTATLWTSQTTGTAACVDVNDLHLATRCVAGGAVSPLSGLAHIPLPFGQHQRPVAVQAAAAASQ